LRARLRGEFEQEALALAGDGRRFDYAPPEDDDLASFGIEFGYRTGRMNQGQQLAREEEAEQATGARENP
jgi:hypothetical protein